MNDKFFGAFRVLFVSLSIALFTVPCPTHAIDQTSKELHIAVAANFLQTFKDLQSIFEAQTDIKLIASSGSTGQLYHQIRFGAPFDIFLSADSQTSRRLIQEGKALASSYFTYANGRLVLWSANSTLNLDNGLVLSAFDSNKRMGIANPKTAPYGKATQQTLVSLGVDQQWRKQLITGQNITQTHQFIASGNVDMGFVSLAQLRFFEKSQTQTVNHWLVPQTLHEPIEQTAILLTANKHQTQAMLFLNFLQTPVALAVLKQYGYE